MMLIPKHKETDHKINIAEELQRFQDKYNALMKDIEATKMPLSTRRDAN